MSLLTFFVPYKKYLFGAALIAAAYGGYSFRDASADRDIAELNNRILVQAVQQMEMVAQYTESLQGIANKVEEQSYANRKKHEAELAYYRNLIEQSGGLHDNGTTPGGSSTTGGTSSNTAATSGGPLSREATEFLLGEANKADQVVSQFKACQDYVFLITEQLIKGATNE